MGQEIPYGTHATRQNWLVPVAVFVIAETAPLDVLVETEIQFIKFDDA